MSKKTQHFEQLVQIYIRETGNDEIDMNDLARFAIGKGWQPPNPLSEVEVLAKQFARSARQANRVDAETGRPYRSFHSVVESRGERQLRFWVDIDRASRKAMGKSLNKRREQMIGDGYHASLDAEHWNRMHPDEEPIQLCFDLNFDIEIKKSADDAEDEDAG